MAGFDDNIPKYIAELEGEISKLGDKQRALDWGHECDCEYCTEQSDIPPETEEENERLGAEILDYKRTISSMKGFAKLKGVDIDTALTDMASTNPKVATNSSNPQY